MGKARNFNELRDKLPPEVRAQIDAEVKERLANGGNDLLDMSPQEFGRFVRSEMDEYQRVVKGAGIQPQ